MTRRALPTDDRRSSSSRSSCCSRPSTAATRYDFRHYARASLRRRRPRARCQARSSRASRCCRTGILRDADAVHQPADAALTVPVSDLFRDPVVLSRAARARCSRCSATYPSLKIWVAGCSTGEEVYSLAILLDEAGLLDRTIIYATDINPDVAPDGRGRRLRLDRDRPGSPATTRRRAAPRSLADYYTAAYDNVLFDRRLRARVTFSDHCLATDHGLRRGAAGVVPQRADLLRPDSCRTAPSACSATRWRRAASSASDRTSGCDGSSDAEGFESFVKRESASTGG